MLAVDHDLNAIGDDRQRGDDLNQRGRATGATARQRGPSTSTPKPPFPVAAEWADLTELGFERAKEGRHYRYEVVCAVNGEGYWYTRCEVLDGNGVVVGSAKVEGDHLAALRAAVAAEARCSSTHTAATIPSRTCHHASAPRATHTSRATFTKRSRRDRLKSWLNQQHEPQPPKSPIGTAIRYALSHWNELGKFLEDARIPLDNNASERALGRVALGPKSYLFVGDVDAGRNIAGLYSLPPRVTTSSCRAAWALNPGSRRRPSDAY